ncbi:DUF3291 domain-containing protein [uncultured Algibacter sp.]|uniref:DUF3291 domain-containing protein n=1 Tax=uncultured Algibacter sp. TaxID=298659 RepID=UPI002611CE89|nr:DUF3291 domain-containing protein [uncultured Algibacter sp.]
MKATITLIELKGPFKFFLLSRLALKIVRQLKVTDCKAFKNTGVWTKHYTMTLWNNEEELKDFAFSGAHLEVMKSSKKIAKEIRTITIDAEELPSWNEAKELLTQGKVIKFK